MKARLKSRPTEIGLSRSAKLRRPTKRADPNPVCVDHSWNDSQKVSTIGTTMNTAISATAGVSISQVEPDRERVMRSIEEGRRARHEAKRVDCTRCYWAARSRIEAASAWAF